MCDFGHFSSLSSNAISLENSMLPDMDELLDKLENEPFQHVADVIPSQQQLVPSLGTTCFKHEMETNGMEDKDIFEQIDRMAEQIKTEESGSEVEGTKEDEFVNQTTPLGIGPSAQMANTNCFEHFVAEMVTSILEQVLKEASDELTTQTHDDGIKAEEKMPMVEKGEQRVSVAEEDGVATTTVKTDEKKGKVAETNSTTGETKTGIAKADFKPDGKKVEAAEMDTETVETKSEIAKTGAKIDETEVNVAMDSIYNKTELEVTETDTDVHPDQSSCPQSLPTSSLPKFFTVSQRSGDSLAIVHDLSVALDEFKLTESELQLGKKKPYWIPDEECMDCMLCSTRFSMVNRRHHCRACGRVLCRLCCSKRRLLAYMEEKEGKQRVCVPCNRTLDRIDEYEQRMHLSTPRSISNSENETAQNGADSDAIRQQREQTNDGTDQPQGDQTDGVSRPKKKSLLKQSHSTGGPSVVANEHHTCVAVVLDGSNVAQSEDTRPMSVPLNISNKRSVTFRDGVNPGHDGTTPNSNLAGQNRMNSSTGQSVSAPSPYQWLVSGRATSSGSLSAKKSSIQATDTATNASSKDNKKLPRKISRRSRERRMEEEAQSLLILKDDGNQTQKNECRVWLVERLSSGAEEMIRRELADIGLALCNSVGENDGEWTIALRRNFHLRIARRKENSFHILSVSTHGLASFGVDELFLALQYEPETLLNSTDELLALLQQFDLIFQQCLNPQEDSSIDHQMGIRKCVSRMARLYPLFRKGQPLFGHRAASILFHRPHPKQNFANFLPPSRPFLTGVFVHLEELSWAMCVPCRLLLRLGMLSGEYPFPVINVCREKPLFTSTAVQNSVLKVFNDFRHWSFRMARLSGCSVAICDSSTDVFLLPWALDEVRQIVACNRNMFGWALDELSTVIDLDGEDNKMTEVDAHLVCVQEEVDDGMSSSFITRVFSSASAQPTEMATKKVVGASFVIFDGALRGNEQFLISLVEDGLVVRLNADLMEELVKSLMAGDSLSVTNEQGHRFSISFPTSNNGQSANMNESHKSLTSSLQRLGPGSLCSPIDGQQLDGHVQYGLDRARLLRSLNFFQFSSEWALRLSAVINMLPGKFPSALQPRFFDLCEQLVTHILPTLEPFLQELIAADQRSISLRVHVDGETICYETEKWLALPEQHFVWTVTLDEQLVPFLYALCAWLPSVFFVELHTFIVSTRPLPALTVPDSPGDS